MEIKNSLLKNLDPYRNKLDPNAEVAGARAQKAEPSAKPAAGGDKVSLSPSARLHTLARSEAGKTPEVRQEKVDALKERIASGEYSIDTRKVAENLLRDEAFMVSALKD